MLKTMVFIDGTWLYRNTPHLGRINENQDYHLDYEKLPKVVLGKVAAQLGVKDLDLVRTTL